MTRIRFTALCLFLFAFTAPEASTAESRAIKIAAVQFESILGEPAANYTNMERLAKAAVENGARWILFHELSLTDHKTPEPIPAGPWCTRMTALAKTLDCYLGFGMAESDGERVYITHVFVGPEGFIHRYRKTWLWEPLGEWKWYDPGTGPEPFWIDGIHVTCFICSDGVSGRSIERAQSMKPAVVFYPNSRPGKIPYDQFGSWARTIGAPMIFSNRSGAKYTGGSAVFDREGKVQASANKTGDEEILYHHLNLSGIENSVNEAIGPGFKNTTSE
jgi:predicted amidohydrolase